MAGARGDDLDIHSTAAWAPALGRAGVNASEARLDLLELQVARCLWQVFDGDEMPGREARLAHRSRVHCRVKVRKPEGENVRHG